MKKNKRRTGQRKKHAKATFSPHFDDVLSIAMVVMEVRFYHTYIDIDIHIIV